MTLISTSYLWIFIEIVFYIFVYHRLFVTLSRKLGHSDFLEKWSVNRGTAIGMANLTVSGLFGLLASSFGLYILHTALQAKEDQAKETETLSEENARVKNDFVTRSMLASIAYFVYDLWAMFKVHTIKIQNQTSLDNHQVSSPKLKPKNFMFNFSSYVASRPLMIAHHFVMAFFFIPMILIRRDHEPGDILISCTFILETSTPFVALRAILSDLRATQSVIYFINGLLMLAVFLTCRILIYPFFYYVYGLSEGIGLLEALLRTPWYCSIGMIISFLPQVYWFKLMFKGALKMLKSRDHMK